MIIGSVSRFLLALLVFFQAAAQLCLNFDVEAIKDDLKDQLQQQQQVYQHQQQKVYQQQVLAKKTRTIEVTVDSENIHEYLSDGEIEEIIESLPLGKDLDDFEFVITFEEEADEVDEKALEDGTQISNNNVEKTNNNIFYKNNNNNNIEKINNNNIFEFIDNIDSQIVVSTLSGPAVSRKALEA